MARALPGRPVQVLWTRSDDYRHGYFQSASAHRLAAGWSDEGAIRVWGHRKASALHNARGGAPSAAELADPVYLRDSSWGVYDVPYAIPNLQTEYAPRPTHVPIGPWRAVYAPSSIFARECFLDEVARALKVDPIALRLRLLEGESILSAGGGVVVCRSEEAAERARSLAWHARLPKDGGPGGLAPHPYDHHSVGFNYLLPTIHAALGLSQLARMDEFLEAKRHMAARYADHWAHVPPDGESYAMGAARIAGLLEELRACTQPIVLVSHGAVSRVIRGLFAALPPELQDANPRGIWRLVDGQLTKAPF